MEIANFITAIKVLTVLCQVCFMEFVANFTCYALPCTQPYRTRGQLIITAVGLAQHSVIHHARTLNKRQTTDIPRAHAHAHG